MIQDKVQRHLNEERTMKIRRTTIFFAVLAAFILVGSLLSGLDTQASEPFGRTVQGSSELANGSPDLIVSRIDVLTMTATSLDYLFVIQNIGDAVADIDGANPSDVYDNVNFQGVLSKDAAFGGDDIGAGGSFLTAPAELAPGEEYTYTTSTGMAGFYYFDYDYLFVTVDVVENLVESNEDNNRTRIELPDGPDLIVENVEVLSIDSVSIIYQFTVRNIGDGMADLDGPDEVAWDDNVNFQGLLSPDDILDPSDKGVGGGYLNPPIDPAELYPGDVFTKSFSAGMGGANYLDFHYLFVEIDGVGNLPETNEDNNIGMTEILHYSYLPLILR
jgi:hypothetical protein